MSNRDPYSDSSERSTFLGALGGGDWAQHSHSDNSKFAPTADDPFQNRSTKLHLRLGVSAGAFGV
jgi:hypothetical protein